MQLRRSTLFALLIPILAISCTPSQSSGRIIVGSTATGDLMTPEQAEAKCRELGKTSILQITKTRTDNICI